MKILSVVVLLFSLPGWRPTPPPRPPVSRTVPQPAHKGGTWYFAENGHAVYCYGPVVHVAQPDRGLQKVATFCQGDKIMVPLKD
jgi:hypothetical protein